MSFLSQHIFIHIHNEKCGGSTLEHYLTILFGRNHVVDLRPYNSRRNFIQAYQELRKRKDEMVALSGHMPYSSLWIKLLTNKSRLNHWLPKSLDLTIHKKPCYISTVRDPVERLISLFRYLRIRPEHYLYNNYLANNDFDGFIQALIKDKRNFARNGMCEQISGKIFSAHPFEDAKKAFDENYLAIVPYNKTHELANTLAKALNLPLTQPQIINPTEITERVNMREETRALLQEKCADDAKLYLYVCKHYSSKLNQFLITADYK